MEFEGLHSKIDVLETVQHRAADVGLDRQMPVPEICRSASKRISSG